MTKKVRFIPMNTCGLQIREGEGQEESRTVVGTPIVFGVRSVNLTPWSSYREVYEIMEPGCISEELLRSSDVVLNLNHSMKVTDILGRFRGTDKDTLKLSLETKNVKSQCEFPKTNNANDTIELIKRGDITGMSFAFEDDWEDSENGVSYERMKEEDHDGKEVWVRHVKRVTALYDVSIVTHPAYEQTSVASREQGDEMMKTIDAQIAAAEKREAEKKEPANGDQEGNKQREEAPATQEQPKDEQREENPAAQPEGEQPDGEKREETPAAESGKGEGETDEEREQRELDELEEQEREMQMQREYRRQVRRHMSENFDNIIY